MTKRFAFFLPSPPVAVRPPPIVGIAPRKDWGVGSGKNPDVAAAGVMVANKAEKGRLSGSEAQGEVLAVSTNPFEPPGGTPAAPGVLGPVPVQEPPAAPSRGMVDLYSTAVDLNQVLTPQEREAYKQNLLSPGMAPWVVVVLSAVTIGIFGTVYLQLKQSRLPVVKPNDPSAAKAIGFLFIPFFNLYWYFVVWRRLVDRLNFQYRLRGRPAPIDRGQMTAAQILALLGSILIFGQVVGWVWVLVFAAKIQSASNDLAAGKV